jgi:hypothetical protein
MKVLGNLTVNKDSSTDYPFGANIQNETDTISGTPVVREIYGDVLMNIYRLLELAKITPTNTEDNDTTQYQIVDALKKLPNSLNDIEQILTLSGSVWSVPFDLSILPNKYFFIARASDAYVGSTTFKGSGTLELPFTSSGFNASDELLVIIDSSSVRAYSLSKLSETPDFLPTIISTPLRFSEGSELYYLDSGKLYKNIQVWDLQNLIRVDQSDGTLILQESFIMQGYVVCVVLNPATDNYEFYAFDLLDLNTVIVLSTDLTQDVGVNLAPIFYADNDNLYVTNDANTNVNDYSFFVLKFDATYETINYLSDFTIDVSFQKTANGTTLNNKLYVLKNGFLDFYNLSTLAKTTIGYFPAIDGELFSLNGSLYLNQMNIAHKLNL